MLQLQGVLIGIVLWPWEMFLGLLSVLYCLGFRYFCWGQPGQAWKIGVGILQKVKNNWKKIYSCKNQLKYTSSGLHIFKGGGCGAAQCCSCSAISSEDQVCWNTGYYCMLEILCWLILLGKFWPETLLNSLWKFFYLSFHGYWAADKGVKIVVVQDLCSPIFKISE